MNSRDFKLVFENRVKQMGDLLVSKSAEYSSDDDKLRNFRVAAAMDGTTMEKALDGMKLKHDVSIKDMVNGRVPITLKMIHEKITDDMNYLSLLEAVFIEKLIIQTEARTGQKVSVKDAIDAMNNEAGVYGVKGDSESDEIESECQRIIDILKRESLSAEDTNKAILDAFRVIEKMEDVDKYESKPTPIATLRVAPFGPDLIFKMQEGAKNKTPVKKRKPKLKSPKANSLKEKAAVKKTVKKATVKKKK